MRYQKQKQNTLRARRLRRIEHEQTDTCAYPAWRTQSMAYRRIAAELDAAGILHKEAASGLQSCLQAS